MKYLKKTKKGYEFSFDKLELKDVFTSLDLIYKGMPEDDLTLQLTRTRIKKMVNELQKVLTEAQYDTK